MTLLSGAAGKWQSREIQPWKIAACPMSSAALAAGQGAKEPTDLQQEEAWEERRDAFNQATSAGVAKLLPPGEAERIGFTSGFLELLERDFDKAK